MAENTHQIRAEIADTRERIAETAGAVGYKVDVPDRMRDAVTETADAVRGRVTESVSGAREAVTGGARRVADGARGNPIGAFLGGAAAGLLAGMLIPTTRVEDEKLGPAGERLRERAIETGERAIERGTEVASRVGDRATEAVERVGEAPAPSSGSSMETVESGTRDETDPPTGSMWSLPAAPDAARPETLGE